MKTKFLFLAALFILSFSPANASNVNFAFPDGTGAKAVDYCGVTGQQIYEYMLDRGYVVTQIVQISGTCNVDVSTTIGKKFIVYISNGVIGGYEEWNQ